VLLTECFFDKFPNFSSCGLSSNYFGGWHDPLGEIGYSRDGKLPADRRVLGDGFGVSG
jgi:hypothetical protein